MAFVREFKEFLVKQNALALAVAVIIVAVLATAGLFSRAKTVPQATTGVNIPVAGIGPDTTVVVAIEATVDVQVTVTADGTVAFDHVLRAGEGESFQAEHTLIVRLDRGNSATITVNGHDLGSPGKPDAPYERTFQPSDFRRAQPSPGPSVG